MNDSKTYINKARKQPAIINSVISVVLFGFILLKNKYIQDTFRHFLKSVENILGYTQLIKLLKYIVSVSILTAVILIAVFALYYLSLREIGKLFPEAFIKHFFLLPTSRFLCVEDKTFSQSERKVIIKKIENKYSIPLKCVKNKTRRNKDYLKSLESAVSKLRNDTRNDEILFNYNCIYGFWRNLTGGLLLNLALLLTFFIYDLINKGIHFFSYSCYLVIFFILIAFIVILTVVTDTNGRRYAKQLFSLL